MQNKSIYQIPFFTIICIFILFSFSCTKEDKKEEQLNSPEVSLRLTKEYWDGELLNEYFYGPDKKLVKVNHHNPSNGVFTYYVEFEYNSIGKISKAKTYTYSKAADKFIFNRYITNEYLNDKEKVCKQFFVDTLGNEILANIFNLEYDKNGRLTRFITQIKDANGNFQPKIYSSYEYNEKGNIISSSSYNFNYSEKETLNVYEYDDNKNPFYENFNSLDIPLEHYTPNNIVKVTTRYYSRGYYDVSSSITIDYNKNKYPVNLVRIYKDRTTEKRILDYEPI